MGARILVVDDAAFTRGTMSEILKKGGYEVCGEAENGKEAVEMYKRLRPDVVTMDIVMPEIDGMDGIAALRKIIEIDPKARVLMVTAMGQRSLELKSIRAGAKEYIIKPYQPLKVIEAVEKVLRG